MLHFLQQIVATIGPSTFIALVFVLLVLESAVFLGMILPGESLVLVAGALGGFKLLNVWVTLIVVIIAVIVGDCCGYLLGKHYGEALVSKWSFARRHYQKHRERLEGWFRRWGAWTVVIGRLVSFGRAFTPFTAGLSGMRARRFIPMAALAGAIWGGGFIAAGYFFASNFEAVRHWVEWIGIGIFILIVVTFGVTMLWNWLSKRRQQIVQAWQERVVEPIWSRYGDSISRLASWVRARLSPAGYLGVHITAGIVVVVGLGYAFGSIAEGLVNREPIVQLDQVIYNFVAAHHTPALDAVMWILGAAANSWLLLAIGLGVAGWFVYQRMPIFGFSAILAYAGAWALALGLEHFFSGAVPNLTWAGFARSGHTFPNLAMTQATAVYAMVWYAGALRYETWRMQVLNLIAIVYLIFLIGIATIYSGHMMSAVAGAFALGGCWVAICITAGRAWRRLKGYAAARESERRRAASGYRL